MAKNNLVYVCSPYRGDRERNTAYARELTGRALQMGLTPVTPHLYLPQVLDDDNKEERARGLAAALEILKECGCIFIGDKYGITEGMRAEIEFARKEGIEIVGC